MGDLKCTPQPPSDEEEDERVGGVIKKQALPVALPDVEELRCLAADSQLPGLISALSAENT